MKLKFVHYRIESLLYRKSSFGVHYTVFSVNLFFPFPRETNRTIYVRNCLKIFLYCTLRTKVEDIDLEDTRRTLKN
jgi:hypothetical protein